MLQIKMGFLIINSYEESHRKNVTMKQDMIILAQDTMIVNSPADSQLTRWRLVPFGNKYPGWSPYNYTLNNPLKYVDPVGREIGNYYDENGNYIGTDGISDNKNYIIPSTIHPKFVHHRTVFYYQMQSNLPLQQIYQTPMEQIVFSE